MACGWKELCMMSKNESKNYHIDSSVTVIDTILRWHIGINKRKKRKIPDVI